MIGCNIDVSRRKSGGSAVNLSSSFIGADASAGDVVGVLSSSFGSAPRSFSVMADPDSKFSVSGTNLTVRAGASFNYATKTAHSVTIRVTENGGAVADITFSVNLIDFSYGLNDLEFIVPAGTGGSVPAAFTSGQWTFADLATDGDLRINITALPSDGGSAITALEYRIGGGPAVTLSGTGTGIRDISPFANGTQVACELRAVNANGNGPWGDTKTATPTETVAPILSSPTASSTGATTATVGVTTDENNGTLYVVLTGSATAPTATQVENGQDHTGTAAAKSANQLVVSAGAKAFDLTGLTASTTYHAHFMHKDLSGNRSGVSTATSFTTGGTGDVTILGTGRVFTSSTDNITYTSDPFTVNSGELLVVAIPLRKTSSTDVNITVASLTYNGTPLNVDLNARRSGAQKPALVIASGQVSGTSATVTIDMTGTGVNMEAIQMQYWRLSNFNTTTPIAGTAQGTAPNSTDDTLIITRTGALAGSFLLGCIAVTDGDEVVTVTQGTEDGNTGTGSGTQDFRGVFISRAVATTGDLAIAASWTDRDAFGGLVEVRKA